MVEKKFRLILYEGHCPSDGCCEVSLLDNINDEFYERIRRYARKRVDNYLMPGLEHFIQIESGSFLESEKESKIFVEQSLSKIRGTSEFIKLVSSYHGDIDFDRIVIYNDWAENQRSELISEISKIHSPLKIATRRWKTFENLGPEKFKAIIEKEINNLWNKYLKFY